MTVANTVVCRYCKTRPPAIDRKLCRRCLDRFNDKNKASKAAGVCCRCHKRQAMAGKVYCLICCARNRQRNKVKRDKAISLNLCIQCTKSPPVSGKKYCSGCHEKRRAWGKLEKKLMRQAVLEAYGNACACCGETEPLFLEVDHVNNDGYLDKIKQSHELCRKIIKLGFTPQYQILCSNCNKGKYRNGGICPHKTNGTQKHTQTGSTVCA